jgi:hypothetical protein
LYVLEAANELPSQVGLDDLFQPAHWPPRLKRFVLTQHAPASVSLDLVGQVSREPIAVEVHAQPGRLRDLCHDAFDVHQRPGTRQPARHGSQASVRATRETHCGVADQVGLATRHGRLPVRVWVCQRDFWLCPAAVGGGYVEVVTGE